MNRFFDINEAGAKGLLTLPAKNVSLS